MLSLQPKDLAKKWGTFGPAPSLANPKRCPPCQAADEPNVTLGPPEC